MISYRPPAPFGSLTGGNGCQRGLSGAVPDFDEVVVASDLPALQANLQSVERSVIAVRDAKRGAGRRRQGQSGRKGENLKLPKRMAGRVAARDDGASYICLLDERALDLSKRAANCVPARRGGCRSRCRCQIRDQARCRRRRFGLAPDCPVPSRSRSRQRRACPDARARGSTGKASKPFACAKRICRSVVGEQLPDTTAIRSTGPGAAKVASPGIIVCRRHSVTRAYSTPDDPTMNPPPSRRVRQIWRPTSRLRLGSRRRRTARSRRRRP